MMNLFLTVWSSIAARAKTVARPRRAGSLRKDAPLNAPDMATFYVPGAVGYTDYPALAH